MWSKAVAHAPWKLQRIGLAKTRIIVMMTFRHVPSGIRSTATIDSEVPVVLATARPALLNLHGHAIEMLHDLQESIVLVRHRRNWSSAAGQHLQLTYQRLPEARNENDGEHPQRPLVTPL